MKSWSITRGTGRLLLLASVLVIAYLTLTPAPGGNVGGAWYCVFCGERGLADFLLNLALFAPVGVAIRIAGWSFWTALAAGALYAGLIELAQIVVIPGRDATLGDLIANTAGALLGWWLASRGQLLTRHRWTARCSWPAALVSAVLLDAALVLLVPSFPRSVYYTQWTPDLGGPLEQYRGRVLASRIGTMEFAAPPGRIQDSERAREILAAGGTVEVEFVAGPAPVLLAPIFSVYDDAQIEVFLLGARGRDVVFRSGHLGRVLRLDASELRWPDGLAGVRPGDRLTLAVTRERNTHCFRIGERRRCGVGHTLGSTWTLLYYNDDIPDAVRRALDAIWPALTVLLVHLLLATRSTYFAGAVLLGALALMPLALGFGVTPPTQLIALVVVLLALAHRSGGSPSRVSAPDAAPGEPHRGWPVRR